MEDAVLVRSYRDGNNSSFSKIYDRYVGDIYRFIMRKVWDRETSEDITSQVWVKVLHNIDSYQEQSGATFRSWIYRIAHNTVIDYYRTKKEYCDLETIVEPSFSEDLGKVFDDKKKLDEVVWYLQNLSDKEKEIVFLRVWDDLSYKEISEVLGVSVDNCKQIYSRSIKKVQANITLIFTILLFIL